MSMFTNHSTIREERVVSKGRGAVLGVVFVCVFGLLAAGCGSGGEDSTASPLTKAQFVKQADAICDKREKEKNVAILAYVEEKNLNPARKLSQEDQETVVKDLGAPPLAAMIEELDALGAPSGDEEQVDAIVEAFEVALEEAEADPASVVPGSDPFDEADELAGKYGLEECGEV